MKKTMIFTAAAASAVLLALVSCGKEAGIDTIENDLQETVISESPVFSASIAGATKTTVDVTDGKVVWESDDEITVKDASGKASIYKIESIDDETGKATFVLKEGEKALGEGPYSATYGTEPAAVQTCSATVGKLYMTAPETSGNSFTFTVQSGLMKINLTKAGESVKSITVTGTPTDGAETTYTLTCDPAESIADGKDFYISLPAGSYTRIVVYNAQDGACTLNAASGVAIAKNHIKPVTIGEGKIKFELLLVDLGLSVNWATCNLGASKPEDCGDYYQWGGTSDVNDRSIYLAFNCCSHHTEFGTRNSGWLKYIPSDKSSYWSGTGPVDGKAVLDPEDDAAYAALGGSWRMPTEAEWKELEEGCTWEKVEVSGVPGYKVTGKRTGYTDRYIFLPAAGYREDSDLSYLSKEGAYWSSSLNVESPYLSYCLRFVYDQSDFENAACSRYMGCSVRPVYVTHMHDRVKVPGVPAGDGVCGFKDAYKCRICGKYYEDEEGNVFIGGDAEYELWKSKGGRGYLEPVFEAVDLGLSVKWATYNLGASKPEDSGDYYQWGGISDVNALSISLYFDHCSHHTGSDTHNSGWLKYIPFDKPSYWSGNDPVDNKAVLDLGDDAANAALGGKWRMPTEAEWVELIENCAWEWVEVSGVPGYKVSGKKAGYTDSYIFLPAAGFRQATDLSYRNEEGFYWSSSLNVESPYLAHYLRLGNWGFYKDAYSRYMGCSVRPVYQIHEHDLWTVPGVHARDWESGYKEAYRCNLCGKYYEDEEGKALIGGEEEYEIWKSKGGRGYLRQLQDEIVDLGLSVKWAACNLGATRPEMYGGYYQWAGIEDVTDTSIKLDWDNCPYHTGSVSNEGWTKYVYHNEPWYWSGPGQADDKKVLDPEDDVAHVKLGGKWRMPTHEEFQEMYDNCDNISTTINGIAGRLFTSRINGKSIFLPAAGLRSGDNLFDPGKEGYYWTSTRAEGGSDGHRSALAWRAHFYTTKEYYYFMEDHYRCHGRSIRPVMTK